MCRGHDSVSVAAVRPGADLGFQFPRLFELPQHIAHLALAEAGLRGERGDRWVADAVVVSVVGEGEQHEQLGPCPLAVHPHAVHDPDAHAPPPAASS